jgi:hypothetical protein
MGLNLTYQPGPKVVQGAIQLDARGIGFSMVSEGVLPLKANAS